jgi:hypothetical protein
MKINDSINNKYANFCQSQFSANGVHVPDHEKPGSQCPLSKAHNLPGVLGIWNGEGIGRGRSV